MRTRASSACAVSSTSPAWRRMRRCRLMAGRVIDSAAATSLARRGFLRSRPITASRAGSASAPKVSSRPGGALAATALLAFEPLHEPPLVPLEVLGAVAAVGPVVVAVVVGGGLLRDPGPGGPGPLGV